MSGSAAPKGVNPNATPFIPSFLQQPRPSQYSHVSHQGESFAPASLAPPPPPSTLMTSGGVMAPPPPFFPAFPPYALPTTNRPLYPGLGLAAPYYPQTAPPVSQANRPTYEQVLKSRGTPESKVLSPQQSQPGVEAAASSTAPPPSATQKPIVLLFLGPRGSGKSTQAQKAAEKLNLIFVSAGELIRQKKQPMVELRAIVDEYFAPNAPKKGAYRGISLDRFVVHGDADAYYLQWALTSVFGLPRVFLLLLDWETALSRADSRDESQSQRVKSTQRRLMEYRAHFDVCENIYAKAGVLDRIDCEDQDLDAVHRLIMQRMDTHLKEGNATVLPSKLPAPYYNKDLVQVRMMTEYDKYAQIKQDVQKTLCVPTSDVAPVSLMSGVIDMQILTDPKVRRALSAYYVTLKADGERLVVIKHKTLGCVSLQQKFTCAYDLNVLLAAVEWPQPTDEMLKASESDPIEFILDCEIVCTKGKSHPTIFVFDFIYFYGQKAVGLRFGLRLEALTAYFARLHTPEQAPRVLLLKEYVPAGQLRKLLPDFRNPPFAVDGVVFQPDSNYRYGLDRTLYKWKPQSHCTVDFRLYGCREPEKKGGEWVFEGKVQDIKSESIEEVSVPNLEIHVPDSAVTADQLSDGAVVECVKRVAKTTGKDDKKAAKGKVPTPEVEIWEYVRNRPDKLVPNRSDIAERVSKMEHMSFDTLLSLCDTFK